MFKPLKLPNLDKLRGFAALSVLVYHVIEHTSWAAYPRLGVLVWGRIGWMGVDLFFVISGLVITYNAWGLYRTRTEGWGREYWNRRFRRIIPLYILTGLVFLVLLDPNLILRSRAVFIPQITAHLAFIHNFFFDTHGSINGVNWTIAVEMQFYLLVFLLLPFLMKARAVVVAAVFLVIAWAWRAAVFYLVGDAGVPAKFHYSTQLPGSLDLFAMGILLCKLFAEPRYARVLEYLRRNFLMLAIITVMACALMLQIFWDGGSYWENPAKMIFFKTAIGASACLVVLSAALCPWTAPRVIAAPFDFLGQISYGIYLWHLIVILLLKEAGTPVGIEFLARATAYTVALATLSYYGFEKPWLQGVPLRPSAPQSLK
jgi:peptidoglycan/LPS O-acetylase OafA/YrhL